MARAKDVKITIEGEKELSRKLEQLGVAGRKALAKAIKGAAEQVKDEAKRRVPVDTGNLQRNIIERKAFDDDYGVVYLVGAKYPNAAHAHLVEYGTKSHPVKIKAKRVMSDGSKVFGTEVNVSAKPQPFLRPALDAVGNKARQDAINALKAEWGL